MCVFCGWSGLSDEARSNKPGGRPEAGGGHQGHQWHQLRHCAGHELHQGAGQLCLQFPCSVTCSVGVLCCVSCSQLCSLFSTRHFAVCSVSCSLICSLFSGLILMKWNLSTEFGGHLFLCFENLFAVLFAYIYESHVFCVCVVVFSSYNYNLDDFLSRRLGIHW